MDIHELTSVYWDDIIVGTGMGGATAGYALAKAGRRVLFLEKGIDYQREPAAIKGIFAEVAMRDASIDRDEVYRLAGRSNTEFVDAVKNERFRPIMGSGTGGSSALYGMAMERFWPQDFEPRKYHPNADPDCTLPERWPVTFQEMEPYYQRAEALYKVTCNRPDPLRPDQIFGYIPGRDPNPAGHRLHNFLKRKGYHPYSSPLALDWVADCRFCQSFLCDKNCKNDAAKICLGPAQREHGAVLLAGCQVIRLEADEKRVTAVVARHGGRTISFRGTNIILGLGALLTPALLSRSFSSVWPDGLANRSGLLGRNLMRHYIDLVAIFSRTRFTKRYTLKELALNDFYIYKGEKLGAIGAFGHLPPTLMILDDIESDLLERRSLLHRFFRATRPVVGGVLSAVFSHAGYFALILEDLPFADNRVSWREGPGDFQIAVHYKMRPSEWKRIRRFRALAKKCVWPNPTKLLGQADNLKFLAHASGTCRFGDDPKTSVLNRFNRAHDLENLYVVDSSFFPSAGGTNPALTIAANALRVADHMAANR